MQGYVLAFRPGSGSGAIVADNGDVYSFDGGCAAADLQGGDLVSFDAQRAGGSPGPARNVQRVQRWSQRMTAREKPLVHQLLNTLQASASTR